MKIKKLKTMPYANAHIEIEENNIYLFSYRTLVAQIENNELKVFGLYSATTRKHLGAFAKEYCNCNYHTLKYLYLNKKVLNITTGELFDY